MSDFSTRSQKPTTKEYLEESLDNVLDRQNRNPNGHQSEDSFVSSVIAVRAAKINEQLGTRLNWLYLIIAIATVLLVAVPFFIPSFEAGQLSKRIDEQLEIQTKQTSTIEAQQTEIVALRKQFAAIETRLTIQEEKKENKSEKATPRKPSE